MLTEGSAKVQYTKGCKFQTVVNNWLRLGLHTVNFTSGGTPVAVAEGN